MSKVGNPNPNPNLNPKSNPDPNFYIIEGAVLARESQATMEGGWATAMLARYRDFARVVSLPVLMAGLCVTQRALPAPHSTNSSGNTGSLIYSLPRTLDMVSASDAVVDSAPAHAVDGGDGPSCSSAGTPIICVG